ncbi:MAG TPA: hypothetical protein VKY92_07485 [Verrucomicrobiae bacterium]|jgi:hypothetical protein|nr:hypothetical protein [Verrucomicrobiae bacterium]
MKTNPSARRVVKIRIMFLGLLIVVIAGLEFGLGALMASRLGQTAASQRDDNPVCNVGISDLLAVAH